MGDFRRLKTAAGSASLRIMAQIQTPPTQPDIRRADQTDPKSGLEPGYLVVCWDDPVNLMDYVTHVFCVVFGWPKAKAEFHMLQVHNQGKSVLLRDSWEKVEHFVHELQKYSLHATLERE